MSFDIRKPDLPLRLAFFSLTTGSQITYRRRADGFLDESTFLPPDGAWLEVTQHRLELERLSAEFSGYRIAQISDFHIGTWADRDRLEYAIHPSMSSTPIWWRLPAILSPATQPVTPRTWCIFYG